MWDLHLPAALHRPKPIGLIGDQLFVFNSTTDAESTRVEIWSQKTLFLPHSWSLRWTLGFAEVDYLIACASAAQKCLYLLCTGFMTVGPAQPSLYLFRIDVTEVSAEPVLYSDATQRSIYELADENEFSFETQLLHAGESDVFVYDRSLMRGHMPFTRFVLDHEQRTFTTFYQPLPPDADNIKSVIFGALLDADQRKYVKLTTENELRILHSTEKGDEWRTFVCAVEDSDLNLQKIGQSRALNTTFNDQYTRHSLVSSPIQLIGGTNTCGLIHKHRHTVGFYRLLINYAEQSFRLKLITRIPHSINQGYLLCTTDFIVVLSRPSHVIPTRILTLRESAYRLLQRILGDLNDDKEIRRLCGVVHNTSLI